MTKNNAKIIDVNTLIQAGFDPKTGLPTKVDSEDKETKLAGVKFVIKTSAK